jgi:integrase/recombinase XerD
VRVFCTYLHEAGHVPANPGRLLKRALCSPRCSRALDAEEIERLHAVLAEAAVDEQGRRDRVLFALMLGTGIRIGSALGLDVEDVDLERGELLLRGAKGNRV